MRGTDLGALLLLGALWGASFLFIRVGAPALGPVVLADLRVLLAAGGLAAFAFLARQRLGLRGRWRAYLALGAINAAAPFALVSAAALRLPASLLATLNAVIPLFTALVAAVWLGERLTARKVAGMVLGVAAVAILVGWSPLAVDAGVVLAVGASLLASCCYAVGAIYARRAFGGVPTLELAVGQQLAAGMVLLPAALVTAPSEFPSLPVVLATLALALPSTALAYLLFFRLLARVGPTKTSAVAFLIPGFGLLWGVLLLDESITGGMMIGLAAVVASVLLVADVRLGGRGRREEGGELPVGGGVRPAGDAHR